MGKDQPIVELVLYKFSSEKLGTERANICSIYCSAMLLEDDGFCCVCVW